MRNVRLLTPKRREESGSIIVVLMVIMVLVILSSMLVSVVIGNQDLISSRQSTYTGVASADAGLSDALFRLDQAGELPDNGVLCLNAQDPSDTDCNVHPSAATPQLAGVSYVARTVPAGTSPADATEWIVQSLGNVGHGEGAVQETLTRTALYPYALFGKNSITFNGNVGQSNFATFSPGDGSGFNYCSTTSATPVCVTLGSDGSISCTNAPPSVQAIYFNTGSGGGCGTGKSENINYNVPDPSPPAPPSGGSWTCPNGGQLGSGASPSYPTILSGVYVCTSEVTITGTLTVQGDSPVQLYIMPTSAANTVNSTFLDVAPCSQINTTIPYPTTQCSSSLLSPWPAAYNMPDSKMFQVFTNSIGNLDVSGNHGFVFGGILYAPEATLTTNGCKSYFFGSATINTYTCNGGPNLGFYYDSSLSSYYGTWQVSGYQEIDPSSVCIPDPARAC